MPKPKRPKRPRDFNQLAHEVFREAIGEKPKPVLPDDEPPPKADAEPKAKDPAAVSLGRRGGLKGGPARAKKLTKAERSELARNAANARWRKATD